MDLWTKHFHDMATSKLRTMHTSVHSAPQSTTQVGGSQVQPKIKKVTIDRLKRIKTCVGSVIKKRVHKSVKTKPSKKNYW